MQKPAEQSKVWTKPQLQLLGSMKDVANGKINGKQDAKGTPNSGS